MDKRLRSPNYPALSLPEAVDKANAIYRSLHNHAAPREMIAKYMGYAGLNGASATAISALHKYGLLERDGDEIKISERGRRILAPLSVSEKAAALTEAALSPPLFAELSDKFPGTIPEDDLLKNYLSRKGFAPSALSNVVLAYRQTSEMAGIGGSQYDSEMSTTEPLTMLDQISASRAAMPLTASATQYIENHAKERIIGRYDFEGGAFVRISASTDLDIETALEMVDTLVDLKRKELARKSKAPNATDVADNYGATNSHNGDKCDK